MNYPKEDRKGVKGNQAQDKYKMYSKIIDDQSSHIGKKNYMKISRNPVIRT